MLYYYMGWTSLIGITALVSENNDSRSYIKAAISAVCARISQRVSLTKKIMSAITDKRIKMIHEILKGIKIIKFYAYESEFIKNVSSVRQEELHYVKKISYLKGKKITIFNLKK